MGVQLFFVASALTLCLSMEHRGSSKNRIGEFYLRRLFRIAPMYYLGIIIFFLINYVLFLNNLSNQLSGYTWSGVVTNFLFIHGFIPVSNNTIVPGGWSIGTEVLFYIFFPFLYKYFSKRTLKYLIVTIVVYSLLLLAGAFCVTKLTGKIIVNSSFYYFSIINQLPAFLWGIALYKVIKIDGINKILKNYLIVLIMIVSAAFFLIAWNFYSFYSFFLIVFTSGLFFSALGLLFFCGSVHNAIIEKIGQRSYSIYIFHGIICIYGFPVFTKLFDLLNVQNGNFKFIIVFLITTCISYLFASLTYKIVEKPFIALGNKLAVRLSYLDQKNCVRKLSD